MCALFWGIARSFNPFWWYHRHVRHFAVSGAEGGLLPESLYLYVLRYALPIAFVLMIATYVLLYWLLVYACAPLLVRNIQVHPSRLEFAPLDLDGPVVNPRVAAEFRASEAELRPLGFLPRGTFAIVRISRNVETSVGVFEDPRTAEAAKVVIVTARRVFHHSLNFVSEYDDGTVYTTSNSPLAPVTPPVPSHPDSMAFPQLRDARRLYEVHRARGPRDRRPVGVGDDPVALLARTEGRTFPHWVASGYYYLDEPARLYRATWKGACLMTWRSLWPVPPIRRALRRRRAARMLRELGIA
jgi:hypothetical protein